jgi:hypothetical protein
MVMSENFIASKFNTLKNIAIILSDEEICSVYYIYRHICIIFHRGSVALQYR